MELPIKVALLGCGNMAHGHALWWNALPEARVVALCDPDVANRERLHREKLGSNAAVRRYESYDQLLKDPPEGLRVIDIITPHTLHCAQALAAMDHGYDVLCEKPMVTSSADARRIAEKVAKTGRQFQVAFQAPFTQEFAYIRAQIEAGALGELQTITALSCQAWRHFTHGAPNWRQDPTLSGGGQMYDTGAHLFNAITWLIDRPAVEVFCWTDPKGTPVDINAAVTIKWEGGVLGSVTISGNTPGWQEGIWLAGDKGRIGTGIHGGRIEQFDAQGQYVKYPQVTQANYTPPANFVECLLGRATPRCPVRYGVLHSWLMDGLYQSAAEGRPVKLAKAPV